MASTRRDLMQISIKYIVPDLKPITAAHPNEWIDLRAAEDVELERGEYRKIRLGVAIALPDGFEAIVAARSSTFEKWGIILTNGIGIIDNLYSGDNDEWKVPVMAFWKTKIHKNDRICQFRIIYHQPACDIVPVDTLGNPDRGGFGSTGVK